MLGNTELTREQTWNLAMAIGKVLLKNGAETSRVEDTIVRFCNNNDCPNINVFVTPTMIMIGDETPNNPALMCRIRWRSVNLSNIGLINDFTYNLNTWPMDYEETLTYLNGLLVNPPSYGAVMACFGAALTGASFAYMFSGSFGNFGAAFFTAGLTMCLLKLLSGYRMSVFWENAVAGFCIGFFALAFSATGAKYDMDNVMASSLMPFLPGLAFTNGMRDYMAGDLISGNCRVSEALLFAISLAFGLAVSLIAWRNWGWAIWN